MPERAMVRILLIIIYALASATIGSLAGMMQTLPIGIASGFIAFLLMCQIDGAVLRRRFARQQKKEIASLKKSSTNKVELRDSEGTTELDVDYLQITVPQ